MTNISNLAMNTWWMAR